MCDYSLHAVKTRQAKVDDKLVIKDFGTGTHGFSDRADADMSPTAVCILPGTEIAFEKPVAIKAVPYLGTDFEPTVIHHTTARFRQINKDEVCRHHDALEFPDGKVVLLTALEAGQYATVLQLPAAPKTEAEAREQERIPSAEPAFVTTGTPV